VPSRPGGIPYGVAGPGFGAILAKLTGTTKAGSVGGISATVHSHLGSARTHGHWAAASGHFRGANAHAVAPTGQAALQEAMSLEGVPASWGNALTFIMARESGGNVGVRNPYHSARGLFQLTAANYHYNPKGANSFGNGVEEAQGGIRYIKARYGTAENAIAFWERHSWY
jgi:hypothetical protein